ncbi:MAG: hypothetical protein RSB41_04425 [Bacilli bacterium]
MIDIKRVSEILQYRKWTEEHKFDAPSEWLVELPKIFVKDINETTNYFDNCTEEDISIYTELFEDIAAKSQSKEFVKFIEKLEGKYPNIDMKADIYWAKNALED